MKTMDRLAVAVHVLVIISTGGLLAMDLIGDFWHTAAIIATTVIFITSVVSWLLLHPWSTRV
jgi:hypothetical protein